MRGVSLFLICCACLSAQSANVAYEIDTLAGSNFIGDNGSATLAILTQAEGVAADKSGNLYIADAGMNRIRMVDRAGTIATIAGTGVAGFSGDGGPASAAQLNAPYGIVLDGIGNLYIADLGNARVRKIGLDGNIATLAGGGSLPPAPANEGSPATMMRLSAPRNLAFDSQGALYISDFIGHRIFRVDSTGTFTTFAGTGIPGLAGDNGSPALAELSFPAGLAFDLSGNLYVADSGNHLVRKIANGRISTFAHASTPTGIATDSLGTVYVADPEAGAILTLPSNAPPVSLPVFALDLAFNIDGHLYAAQGGDVIRVSYSGPGSAIAGGGSSASGDGGPATSALLHHPTGVAVDRLGNLYIADRDNNRIRRVAPGGTISTIAGTGDSGNDGDGGPAVKARLNGPSSVAVDASGHVYFVDSGNQRIREITSDKTILAVRFPGLIAPVYAIVDSSGDLFVSDPGLGAILEKTPVGVVTVLADRLNSPAGMALDSAGDLFFTDAGDQRVRRLDPSGDVADIAKGYWNAPRGIAIGPAGDLFVGDSGLEEILHVDSSGSVTVAAGTGSSGFSGDAGPAASAALADPWDLSIDSLGDIYIADRANNRVRRLSPAPAAIVAPELAIAIVNAATGQPGPIAPAMLVYISGTGLTAADQPNTRITFQMDSGDTFAAQILAVDSSKITLASPPQLSGSSAQVEILNQSSSIAQIAVTLAPAAPGLFADSTGQASALNQDGTVNSASNPAASGSIAVLYGTGQGVGALPAFVTIGGYPANVLYAGPVAGYPGLMQINVQLPSGYIGAGPQNVVVTIGDASSQPAVFLWLN
ncbi:MAG TPA: hypothetical protein VKS01_13140 [Bryobacteraceae bacterium]|nr:hypothetical protein [Bryobacteraceae bacterium]